MSGEEGPDATPEKPSEDGSPRDPEEDGRPPLSLLTQSQDSSFAPSPRRMSTPLHLGPDQLLRKNKKGKKGWFNSLRLKKPPSWTDVPGGAGAGARSERASSSRIRGLGGPPGTISSPRGPLRRQLGSRSPDTPAKLSGWLLTKMGKRKKKKNLYYAIRAGYLEQYSSDKDYVSNKAMNLWKLANSDAWEVQDTRKAKHCFVIQLSSTKLEVQAQNAKMRADWVTELSQASKPFPGINLREQAAFAGIRLRVDGFMTKIDDDETWKLLIDPQNGWTVELSSTPLSLSFGYDPKLKSWYEQFDEDAIEEAKRTLMNSSRRGSSAHASFEASSPLSTPTPSSKGKLDKHPDQGSTTDLTTTGTFPEDDADPPTTDNPPSTTSSDPTTTPTTTTTTNPTPTTTTTTADDPPPPSSDNPQDPITTSPPASSDNPDPATTTTTITTPETSDDNPTTHKPPTTTTTSSDKTPSSSPTTDGQSPPPLPDKPSTTATTSSPTPSTTDTDNPQTSSSPRDDSHSSSNPSTPKNPDKEEASVIADTTDTDTGAAPSSAFPGIRVVDATESGVLHIPTFDAPKTKAKIKLSTWMGFDEEEKPFAVHIAHIPPGCEGGGKKGMTCILYRTPLRDIPMDFPLCIKKSDKDVLKMVDEKLASPECQLFPLTSKEDMTELRQLDEAQVPDDTFQYKFGLMYYKGADNETDMFELDEESPAFTEFLECMGDKVELLNFDGYVGGLDSSENLVSGTHSYYTEWQDLQVMYHVLTMMPLQPDKAQIHVTRKRHIGNDYSVIVFKEGGAPFRPDLIKTKYCHAFLVVEIDEEATAEAGQTCYKIACAMRENMPTFGPKFRLPPVYEKGEDFKSTLLQKCVNGERASKVAEDFLKRQEHMREWHMKNIVDKLAKKAARKK